MFCLMSDSPNKASRRCRVLFLTVSVCLLAVVGGFLLRRASPSSPVSKPSVLRPETADEPPPLPNLVLVVLDTLRRDATTLFQPPRRPGSVGAFLSEYDTTPHLASLEERGTSFIHAYSTAPWTVPSHASMFTGKIPSQHGARGQSLRLHPSGGPTAAELLSERGYATAAFYSNPWLNDQATGLLRGFQHRSEAPIGPVGKLSSDVGDQGGRHILSSLEKWLAARDPKRPSFVFVNLLEAHLAYDPPVLLRRRLGLTLPESARATIDWAHRYNAGVETADEAAWTNIRQLYAADVAFADQLLGDLLRILERQGMLEAGVLVVTSDHGENLGEHGLAEHQFSLHESLLCVPLVVADRTGRLRRGRRTDPVMGSDVFTTLLDYAHIGAPRPPHSRSLLQLSAEGERPLVAEYTPHPQLVALMRRVARKAGLDTSRVEDYAHGYRSVLQGTLRLTLRDDGTSFLHDVEGDPEQRRDLSGQRSADVARLREALESHGRPARTGNPSQPMDSATAQRLRSLGYMVE